MIGMQSSRTNNAKFAKTLYFKALSEVEGIFEWSDAGHRGVYTDSEDVK